MPGVKGRSGGAREGAGRKMTQVTVPLIGDAAQNLEWLMDNLVEWQAGYDAYIAGAVEKALKAEKEYYSSKAKCDCCGAWVDKSELRPGKVYKNVCDYCRFQRMG